MEPNIEREIAFEERVVAARERLHPRLRDREKCRPLSAQDYAQLNQAEREALREVVNETGESFERYEERMRRTWPGKVELKPLQWRFPHGRTVRP